MYQLEEDMWDTTEAYRMWETMEQTHNDQPYGLLIMGGDQVYADHVWCIYPVKSWAKLADETHQLSMLFMPMMADMADLFYMDLYTMVWNSTQSVRRMLASVPTLMTWDDHDIFDGWGSNDPRMQCCPMLQGIYKSASKAYFTLQMRLINENWWADFNRRYKVMKRWPDPKAELFGYHQATDKALPKLLTPIPRDNFTYFLRVGRVIIVMLDHRSERTLYEVMSGETWDELFRMLFAVDASEIDHLMFVFPVPVVYADMGVFEKLLEMKLMCTGVMASEMDDLADHWINAKHKDERLAQLNNMSHLGAEKGCRVVLLSGDVHVGGYGVCQVDGVKGNMGRIMQAISSGIVAHPHGDTSSASMALMGLPNSWVDRKGMHSRTLHFKKTDPANQAWSKFLCERNFLRIDAEPTQEQQMYGNLPPEQLPSLKKTYTGLPTGSINLNFKWYVSETASDGTDMRLVPYTAKVMTPDENALAKLDDPDGTETWAGSVSEGVKGAVAGTVGVIHTIAAAVTGHGRS
eukprot:NODE_462_length_3023_cov_16.155387.p1 GENE.NODE_462_length_3023_cov_16.155387~~NODE_462_length_3023_cov_16.155387.p1  ORF type:complete len:519 (-),score=85.40 NODE_462_length_3023_cov_16.155387:285-1841(-)